MNAKDSMRALKALDSNESHLKLAKEGVAVLLSLSKKILDANYQDRQGEVESWASIATVLLDTRISEDLLILHQREVIRIPDLHDIAVPLWSAGCSHAARNIMASIVIPYLREDSK